MNQVNLIGNLTRDVELRYTTEQKPIARFTLAVNEGYGDNQKTNYIPVVVFGKQAENADKFLSKGSKVAVMGRIQTGSYEKDGRTVYTTDVIASNVEYLSTRAERQTQTEQDAPSGFAAMREDDVPWR